MEEEETLLEVEPVAPASLLLRHVLRSVRCTDARYLEYCEQLVSL